MTKTLRCIFNTFRAHIVDICEDPVKRSRYIVSCNENDRSRLFTRKRVWTFLNMVHAILLCFKRSLSSELAEFMELTGLPQTTPEAYIKRRGCISSDLFRDLNLWLNRNLSETGCLKKWKKGRFLCGIDGTRLSLPYTPELYGKYRGRNDKGHNLARGVFITDLINRIIVKADLYPNKTEERKAALMTMTETPFPYPLQQTVFTMDRGYPSLQLMNWFAINTGGFIIRARRDTNKLVKEFMDSDKTSAIVILSLSDNRRDITYAKPEPLQVRLVKRQHSKEDSEPVVYITNLSETDFPDEDITEAYRLRWNSETEIGTAKNQLQIEIFSGIREICIKQDFFAAIILYNLEAVIRLYCNRKLSSHIGKYKSQVDMNCTWIFVTSLISSMFASHKIFKRELTVTVNLFLRMRTLVRPGRSSPRIKKVIKKSGKYLTLTNYKRGL